MALLFAVPDADSSQWTRSVEDSIAILFNLVHKYTFPLESLP